MSLLKWNKRRNEEERSQEEEDPKAFAQGVRQGQPSRLAQGDEEAQVNEPYFPSVQDAQEIHDQSISDHGQPYSPLLDPGKLESAMGRAQNHYYYGEGSPQERLADAAGALAHGIGMSQAFEDGNKRTAFHTTRYFLHANDLDHLSPHNFDDEELADHLIGHGEGTHTLEDTQRLFRSRLNPEHVAHIANILDPIHSTLDPRVFDDPAAPHPILRPELQKWLTQIIIEVLERHGYDNPAKWLTLILTGSLTTYQYSDASDCDVSLFIDTKRLPDWSRAEMIGFMVSDFDGVNLPGTPHPIQAYVVAPEIHPQDLYKPGLRSGYVVFGQRAGTWIVPPERDRVHDVEHEMNDAYTVGLLSADKLDLLLRYEPEMAVEYWHDLHKRRMMDQREGQGDYATSNVVFKMLTNRGLAQQAAKLAGDRFIP